MDIFVMKYFQKKGIVLTIQKKIVVYREKVLEANGDKYWAKTDKVISLDHLGFQEGEIQMAMTYHMRPARDIFSAIEECKKHYRKTC